MGRVGVLKLRRLSHHSLPAGGAFSRDALDFFNACGLVVRRAGVHYRGRRRIRRRQTEKQTERKRKRINVLMVKIKSIQLQEVYLKNQLQV